MKSKKNNIDLKTKKYKSKISFDEEIITKNYKGNLLLATSKGIGDKTKTLPKAPTMKQKKKKRRIKDEHEAQDTNNEIAAKQKITKENMFQEDLESSKSTKILKNKRKRNASRSKTDTNSTNVDDTKEEIVGSKNKQKRKRKQQPSFEEVESQTQDEIQDELDPMQPTINSTESLRKKKKKRYTELLDAKRVKTELTLQQKAINYLSKWKHSKDQWKFEKLTQVWIQNSLYDETKLPDKIWATVVEYFESAKGKVRNDILTKAVTLYERQSISENRNDVMLNRAKSIVQSLNE